MASVSDDLPGVVLRFRSSEQLKTFAGKRHVKVTLDAEVTSEPVWEAALEKLKELKIYTVADFQSELMDALRRENEVLESKSKLLEDLHSKALYEVSRLRQENQDMRVALSVICKEAAVSK